MLLPKNNSMKMNKSNIIFTLVFFTILNVFSQEKINQLDAKGKKDGLWKGTFEESKRSRYEGTFKNGVEVGVFKYFDDTKAQSLIGTREFSENGTVAFTTFIDQKGNKVSEGKTVNRIKEGVWNYYHKASTQLMKVEHYKNGKLDGPQTLYYPSGKVAEEKFYVNGMQEGIYKMYVESGKLVEESNYKNNLFDGPAAFYDALGTLVSKGNFVKDEKKGMWEFYKDGKLIKKEKYPVKIKFQKRTNIPKE